MEEKEKEELDALGRNFRPPPPKLAAGTTAPGVGTSAMSNLSQISARIIWYQSKGCYGFDPPISPISHKKIHKFFASCSSSSQIQI
jgi:hypothetical protein